MAEALGFDCPFIHFETALCEYPIFFAKSSCEILFSSNSSFNIFANRFKKLCNILESSIKKIAESDESSVEKLIIISAIADAFIPETWELNRYMNKLTVGTGSDRTRVLSNADISSVCQNGMQGCYNLGDSIEKYFSSDIAAIRVAVKAWKEGVSLQQKWYAYGDKTAPERYAEKIKKVEPSYEMPKKAGCISFADKKN